MGPLHELITGLTPTGANKYSDGRWRSFEELREGLDDAGRGLGGAHGDSYQRFSGSVATLLRRGSFA